MALSQALEALVEQGKDNALLYFGLANAYRREGALEQALKACQQALRLEADYLDVILLKAQLEFDLGREERAQSSIKLGLEQAERQSDITALAEFKQLAKT